MAVTTVVAGRRPLLATPRDVDAALDLDLGTSSRDGHAKVLVACMMPDHVHLLLKLDGQGKPLCDYIRNWKAIWSKRLAGTEEKPLWQRSFYDHWVRSNEAEELANYIAGNPVRAGLVEDWRDYPFTRWYLPL